MIYTIIITDNDWTCEATEKMKQIEYKNKNGVAFTIDIEKASVPDEANYWGFYMKATDRESGLSRQYVAMIKKQTCATASDADFFLMGEPLEYLRSVCLDNYKDGSHLLFWPDPSRGWVVI